MALAWVEDAGKKVLGFLIDRILAFLQNAGPIVLLLFALFLAGVWMLAFYFGPVLSDARIPRLVWGYPSDELPPQKPDRVSVLAQRKVVYISDWLPSKRRRTDACGAQKFKR